MNVTTFSMFSGQPLVGSAGGSPIILSQPILGSRTTSPSDTAILAATAQPQHLLAAIGFFGVGLLLHRLPARTSSFPVFSSDWKDWARLSLGVASVDRVNRYMRERTGWTPTPWQVAMETVTTLVPLSNGLRNPKAWKQLPLLAAFVPALVQGTHTLTDALNRWRDQQAAHHPGVKTLPSWAVTTGVSLASTIAGVVALRRVITSVPYRRLMGEELEVVANHTGTRATLGAEAVVCARCGGQHLICMSEIGDMLGSMVAWLKGKRQSESSEKKQQQA